MDLAKLIQTTCAALGSQLEWRGQLRRISGTEVLNGKRIVMLDDSRAVLLAFAPALLIASGGNAFFVHHQEQSLALLATQILEHSPDIILFDYFIAQSMRGTAVVPLVAARSAGTIRIGFSSDEGLEHTFMDSGAHGAVRKNTDDVDESILGLALLVERLMAKKRR